MSGVRAGFGLAVRLPLLVLAMAALIAGVIGGLNRIGVVVTFPPVNAGWHGPLMIGGFFGAVIALERAVALTRRWVYLAPLCSGLGALALTLFDALRPAQALLTAGSAVLAFASVQLARRAPALFTATLALAAGCWLAGNLLWIAGQALPAVVPWWIAFLVLTIAGERLELTRLRRPSRARQLAFVLIVAGCLGACALSLLAPLWGWRAFGAALLALTAWLLLQDIARHTAWQGGLTGYIGRCLLAGYVWLGLAGLLLIGPGAQYASAPWDAAAHAILLGFVFSMVFGHAPVIVPAVAHVTVRHHWSFYLPLALLHLSVALRVTGDLLPDFGLRAHSGTLSAAALGLFIATLLTGIVRGAGQGSIRTGTAG